MNSDIKSILLPFLTKRYWNLAHEMPESILHKCSTKWIVKSWCQTHSPKITLKQILKFSSQNTKICFVYTRYELNSEMAWKWVETRLLLSNQTTWEELWYYHQCNTQRNVWNNQRKNCFALHGRFTTALTVQKLVSFDINTDFISYFCRTK